MDWDEYFINMLHSVKAKSKDPNTQVGCIIVGPNHEIRSTGFNGMPRGVKESLSEEMERYERPEKYFWFEHAERNAIANAARVGVSLEGSTLYVDWIPCHECARMIIQAGIKRILIDGTDFEVKYRYWQDRWAKSMKVSQTMFDEAGVDLVVFVNNDKDKKAFDEYLTTERV